MIPKLCTLFLYLFNVDCSHCLPWLFQNQKTSRAVLYCTVPCMGVRIPTIDKITRRQHLPTLDFHAHPFITLEPRTIHQWSASSARVAILVMKNLEARHGHDFGSLVFSYDDHVGSIDPYFTTTSSFGYPQLQKYFPSTHIYSNNTRWHPRWHNHE